MKTSKFIILLILFCVCIFSNIGIKAQCNMGEEDEGVYEQMRFSMNNGLYGDARIRGKILIVKYGNQCPQLYFDVGWLSFKTESYWDTIDFLKLSLRTLDYDREKFEFSYYAIGVSNYELGNYPNAVLYLREALKISDKGDYYKYIGLSYYGMSEYSSAMTEFNRAKEIGSDFSNEETDIYWETVEKLK
ncbi:MAG: hypothetical protein IT281_04265 [Ignavibacteria bacterium]|nr:hypothetical protein [Ignavibacteria bacterium]